MKYILILFSLFFLGCEGKIDLGPKEVNYERDECERCAMMMGDKLFVAQVVSQENGKTYFFDDIGCAVLWLNSGDAHPLKLENVNIYVNNPENDKFVDAKEAVYTTDMPSPMSYNFLAHDPKTFDKKGVDYLTFPQMVNALGKM